MRKLLNFFIIFFAIFSLVGCSNESNLKNAETITVWHWMSDRDDAFRELAKRYEAEKGVKVKFDLYAPSEAYTQRVKASVQTQTLPDVYGVLGEKRDLASFIKSGFVADLTPELEKSANGAVWKDWFFSKAISVSEFSKENEYSVKPGFYGVPLDVTTIQMLYNKKIYSQAGLDPNAPPRTWEEFLDHTKTLKEKGFPGFVSGFGEIWMIDAFATNLAMNLMGEEKVYDTYRGKVAYTDPDWVKVLTAFKQMADRKICVDGAVTMVNKTAEQTFANERATYAFNGSWCVNVYKGMNPNLDYAAILPPKLSMFNSMKIWGGAGTSFVVNEKSPRKQAAIDFLKWLTDAPQQAYFAQETQNLPANKNSLTQISPVLSEFGDDTDNSVHPNTYPVHEIPSVSEAFNKGIQSILIGEKTPEAIAQEVQKLKEKELRKRSK